MSCFRLHSSPRFTTPNTQSAQKYTKHRAHIHASRANKSDENDMTRAKEKGEDGGVCVIGSALGDALFVLIAYYVISRSRLRSCWRFWSGARDNWRGHSSITIYGSYRAPAAPAAPAGVFAWTRFIRPTSFISSIDWISSQQQQRNAAFRAHHTTYCGQRTKNTHLSSLIYGKKIPSACCPYMPMDHLATHMRPPEKEEELISGAFWFCRRRGDLSHLTLLYGASAPFSYITLCREQLSWIIHKTRCNIHQIKPCKAFSTHHIKIRYSNMPLKVKIKILNILMH